MEITAFDLNELIEKMEDEGINNLSEVANTANKPMTNWTAKYILLNSTGETVFVQEVMSGEEKLTSNLKELEIQTTPDGRLYFNEGSMNCEREYLNEFIRTNYPKGV